MPVAENARILVVDDEQRLADTLALILQMAGYSATAVYSGPEALAIFPTYRPLLLITDVIMSGMDGIALAKHVQKMYPDCRILLFSGNADTQSLLQAAERAGYSFEILPKPLPPPQILAKVASLLDQTAA